MSVYARQQCIVELGRRLTDCTETDHTQPTQAKLHEFAGITPVRTKHPETIDKITDRLDDFEREDERDEEFCSERVLGEFPEVGICEWC